MKKAIAKSTGYLECSNCCCEAESCDSCQIPFEDDEDIYCSDDDELLHYHWGCKPKKS